MTSPFWQYQVYMRTVLGSKVIAETADPLLRRSRYGLHTLKKKFSKSVRDASRIHVQRCHKTGNSGPICINLGFFERWVHWLHGQAVGDAEKNSSGPGFNRKAYLQARRRSEPNRRRTSKCFNRTADQQKINLFVHVSKPVTSTSNFI